MEWRAKRKIKRGRDEAMKKTYGRKKDVTPLGEERTPRLVVQRAAT